jgi:geranylgeranyl reductase family protein
VVERADVVIIGGGPAGAATALALARRGVDVVLLDRARFPREKLCGDFLHPLGTAALERLGVLDEVLPRAQVLRGMLIVSPQGREVFARFAGGAGLSLSRAVLDDVVLRAAQRAGTLVRTGMAARAVTRHGDQWHVSTDRGTLEARLLVGADGLHSRVAVAAGLRDRTRRDGRYALGIYVRGLPAHEGFGEMHLGREVYCGVSVFPDGQANVTMVVPKAAIRARHDGAPHGLARDILDQMLAAFPRLYPRVRTAVTSREMRAVGPLTPTGGPVVGDGVLLVGDAAAFTDPLTGQGVSLALTAAPVAARTIADALRRGDLRAAALAPYARWHHHRLVGLRRFLHLVDWLALRTPLIEPLARAWQDRPALATRFLGVIGSGEPARTVLNPAYVSRLLRTCISRA